MKIYVGSDHRGFELKEKICQWLYELKYEFVDLGANKLDSSDDYTKYAEEVALLVRDNKESRGVLLCGSGVGVDVMANKFDGIRASIGKDVFQVEAGRNDDNMNVLVIAADYTEEKEAKAMLIAFLETKYENISRHERRIEEIERIEENN